ncbi:hypothetical protein GCM10017687_08140 [Streptomyces echinatus]|uniref:hypothetical protein n=1 Tax=Streptomyces echinatus TaxID=67293 RepID=UPI0031F18F33
MGLSTDPGHLAVFANAAAARLGCAPIAPKGADRAAAPRTSRTDPSSPRPPSGNCSANGACTGGTGAWLLRGRIRPLLAASLAGMLLGAGGMAWQTQAGRSRRTRCAGARCPATTSPPRFREPDDVKAVEAPVLDGGQSMDGPTGSCQLTNSDGDAWALTARVHRLDDRKGDDGQWADEFLSARLTPLGGGLLGMASDNRAWLALPDGCLGRPSDFDGPTVVDIARGSCISDMEPRTEERTGWPAWS